MSGGLDISVVVAPSPHSHRLPTTVRSIAAALQGCGLKGEVVVGPGCGDPGGAPVRTVTTETVRSRAAAETARGHWVVLVASGDLLPAGYLQAVWRKAQSAGDADTVVRPETVATYGGAPAVRRQSDLLQTAEDRARAVFFPPFAPALAARRDLLLRLDDRPFDLAADWRWTLDTHAQGVAHLIAPGATYVTWTPPAAAPVLLPVDSELAAQETARDAARLKAEIQALRASTSWRITGPLREAVEHLRRRW